MSPQRASSTYPLGVPLGDPRTRTEEIVERLFTLVDQLRCGFAAAVATFDLSPPQAKCLRYLAHAGPVPMRDVALQLGCDASNVTGIVDRLEQRGLVERRAAPADRRVKTLVITSSGTELAYAMWVQVLRGAVGMIGLPEDDQVELLVLLRRLGAGDQSTCRAAQAEL